MIRAGKPCARCPPPIRPTANQPGNLVLGTDAEQNKRIAAALRAERQVRALTEPDGALAYSLVCALFNLRFQ